MFSDWYVNMEMDGGIEAGIQLDLVHAVWIFILGKFELDLFIELRNFYVRTDMFVLRWKSYKR